MISVSIIDERPVQKWIICNRKSLRARLPSVSVHPDMYQQCREVDAAVVEVWVPSSSHPDKRHHVIIMDRDDPSEGICDCEGFGFRGYCRHLNEAEAYTCKWTEGDNPQQTEEQRRQKVCPVCGGKTEWMMEDD
jgi:hypothetical protein